MWLLLLLYHFAEGSFFMAKTFQQTILTITSFLNILIWQNEINYQDDFAIKLHASSGSNFPYYLLLCILRYPIPSLIHSRPQR